MKFDTIWRFRYAVLSISLSLLMSCDEDKEGQNEKARTRSNDQCVSSINIEDELLWVASSRNNGFESADIVEAFEISDPTLPSPKYSLDVENEIYELTVHKNNLMLFSVSRVELFDYDRDSQPKFLIILGAAPGVKGEKVVPLGDQLLISANSLVIAVYEEGNFKATSILEGNDELAPIVDIMVNEPFIYTLEELGGFDVITYDQELGLERLINLDVKNAQYMTKIGEYLYLTGTSRDRRFTEDEVGLQILNISEPNNPRIIKNIPMVGRQKYIESWNQKIIIVNSTSINFYDTLDPENPVLTASLNLEHFQTYPGSIFGKVSSITVHPEGIAYVSLICRGWLIVDIRGDQPKILRHLN